MGIQTILWVLLASQSISTGEYRVRRERLMSEHADGIVLLHARSTAAGLTDHGFKQDAAFFYFTGLSNQPSAILALDGPARESVLFVPEAPPSFGSRVEGVSLVPGKSSARTWGLDRVVSWDGFEAYVKDRMAHGVTKLYLDRSRRPVPPGNPDGLWPMAGDKTLWRRALEKAFPEARLESAAATIQAMRWVKSDAEVAVLRRVAEASASALLAGMKSVDVDVRQRSSEMAVVAGCIEAGAEGPSFWPWTMSGPNAHASSLTRSFYDYHHLDRTMKTGELVRVDVGCDLGHYEGDVGRTVPVSGAFRPEQAEAWDLLIAAYQAGLGAMRAGITRAELAEVSRAAVRKAQPTLVSEHAKKAARAMLGGGDNVWHVHGVGVDGGEERLPRLEAGSVIAFEPGFSVDDDAYYLEDMILITETGHEILTKGLPYTAEEIARAMK